MHINCESSHFPTNIFRVRVINFIDHENIVGKFMGIRDTVLTSRIR